MAAVGCTQVPAETWLAEQDPDALVAEARIAITQARTPRVATILLDQIQGSLSRAVQEILQTGRGSRQPCRECQLAGIARQGSPGIAFDHSLADRLNGTDQRWQEQLD